MLVDTNILIFLQERNADIARRIVELTVRPAMSLITLIELEGGIARNANEASARREALNRLSRRITTIPMDHNVVGAYARILASTGFSRPRILDRLIAATAIAHDLTLITTNGPEFRDIPGLKLEVWPRPPQ